MKVEDIDFNNIEKWEMSSGNIVLTLPLMEFADMITIARIYSELENVKDKIFVHDGKVFKGYLEPILDIDAEYVEE